MNVTLVPKRLQGMQGTSLPDDGVVPELYVLLETRCMLSRNVASIQRARVVVP